MKVIDRKKIKASQSKKFSETGLLNKIPKYYSSDKNNNSKNSIVVTNPATGESLGEVDNMKSDDIKELAIKARNVNPAWQALGLDGRKRVMKRMQAWILDNMDDIIATIRSETGKTYEDALLAEIGYGLEAIKYWTDNADKFLADKKVKSSNSMLIGKKFEVSYQPLGVIGIIGPWNYPLTNSFGDAIPALIAGNCVILKPSQITPLTSLKLLNGLIESGMPPGVFQVATGDGETGKHLIDNVDMISFTGSTKTGRLVAEQAGKNLIPVSLELGGADAAIVCADADIERAVNVIVNYAFFNAGQTCISIERVYVHAAVYDEFIELVKKKTSNLRTGFTSAGSSDIGAITFEPQIDIINSHIKDALSKGAKTIVSGASDKRFIEPIVLTDVDHSMLIMNEETFGPVMPVMKVSDDEVAIKLANDSVYGLSASVFSSDIEWAKAIAKRLNVGTVSINDAIIHYTNLSLPMGGVKESGIGTRHGGAAGILKYCKPKSVLITGKLSLKADPHFYPYKPRRTNLIKRFLKFKYRK